MQTLAGGVAIVADCVSLFKRMADQREDCDCSEVLAYGGKAVIDAGIGLERYAKKNGEG